MAAARDRFGRLMRRLREESKKTMGDVADHLGYSLPYLSDVERGNRAPLSQEKILQVSLFLRVDPQQLLEAAAVSRGAFELNSDVRPRQQHVGAMLMRGWSELTDEQLEQLEKILSVRRED